MKKKIRRQILSKTYNGFGDVKFSDLPKDLQPDDVIQINKCDSYYSENESWDSHTELIVFRDTEETDEEYQKRLQKEERQKTELKQRRYENYLKLKKEFENS